MGLRDEKILTPKVPLVNPGTDTRNCYYDGWDVSI